MLNPYYMEIYMANRRDRTLRQEKKYELELERVLDFEKELIFEGFYINHLPNQINNIYFDSQSLQSANENIEGFENRMKYRIRWYNNSNQFSLEKKIKNSSSGYKEKVSLNSKDLEEAITKTRNLTKLEPSIRNTYFRKYFIRKEVRITIDTHIKFYLPKGLNSVSFPKAIIEVKYPTDEHFTPKWKTPVQLTKFSKYLKGLEAYNRV